MDETCRLFDAVSPKTGRYRGIHPSICPALPPSLNPTGAPPRFNGADYVPERDDTRLSGQIGGLA